MMLLPVACAVQRIGHAEPKLGRSALNVTPVLIPTLGGPPVGARRSHPVKNPAAPRLLVAHRPIYLLVSAAATASKATARAIISSTPSPNPGCGG
jgi:hypothetical protein